MLVKSQEGLKPFAYFQPGHMPGRLTPSVQAEAAPVRRGAREVSSPCLWALRFAANRSYTSSSL